MTTATVNNSVGTIFFHPSTDSWWMDEAPSMPALQDRKLQQQI